MAAPTSQLCSLRWCDEPNGHTGPHRRVVADTATINIGTGKPAIVQLAVQGESARVRALVLTIDGYEAGLTWPQAKALQAAIGGAIARYGGAS